MSENRFGDDWTPLEAEDLEEMERRCRDYSRVMRAQYEAHKEVGFTPNQAFRLIYAQVGRPGGTDG